MTTLDRPATAWRPPALLGGVALGLTVLDGLLGSPAWPVPRRISSGWQVADVPASLLPLVLAIGIGYLAVAALLVTPPPLNKGGHPSGWTTGRSGGPVPGQVTRSGEAATPGSPFRSPGVTLGG